MSSSTTSPSKPKDSTFIGKNYRIEKTIGQGTFGKVKLATHLPTNEYVAIKILEKTRIQDNEELERIEKEIKYLKTLNHPNIIQIYEVIEDIKNYYIVMEYASGGELFNYIVQKEKLSESEASYFYSQVIHSIEEIHKHKICHRDIKPENILLTPNKVLKMIDFGLSNEYDKYLSTPCGSPCYASPEMIYRKKYIGLNVDIWASGILLFAMVCGYLPFDDKNNERLFEKIIQCHLEFPPEYETKLSMECKDLISRILIANPSKRIKLEEIKKHSFLQDGNAQYDNTFKDEVFDKDDYVVAYMTNKMGYDGKGREIKTQISNNRHNNVTTTYKLIKKKIIEGRFNYEDVTFINEVSGGTTTQQFGVGSVDNSKYMMTLKQSAQKEKRSYNITPSLSNDQSIISELNNVIVKDKEYDYTKTQGNNIIIINNTNMIAHQPVKINPLFEKIMNKNNPKSIRHQFIRKIDTSVSVDKTTSTRIGKYANDNKMKSKSKDRKNTTTTTTTTAAASVSSTHNESLNKTHINKNIKPKQYMINMKKDIDSSNNNNYTRFNNTPTKMGIPNHYLDVSTSPSNNNTNNNGHSNNNNITHKTKHTRKETAVPKTLHSFNININTRAISDPSKQHNKTNTTLHNKDRSKYQHHTNNNNNNIISMKHNSKISSLSPHNNTNTNKHVTNTTKTRNIYMNLPPSELIPSNNTNNNNTVIIDHNFSPMLTSYNTQYNANIRKGHTRCTQNKTKCLNIEIPRDKLRDDLSPHTKLNTSKRITTTTSPANVYHTIYRTTNIPSNNISEYEPLNTKQKSPSPINTNTHAKAVSSNLNSVRNTTPTDSNTITRKKYNRIKKAKNYVSLNISNTTESEEKLIKICKDEQYAFTVDSLNNHTLYIITIDTHNKIALEFKDDKTEAEQLVNMWHYNGDDKTTREHIRKIMSKLY